ncbi:MAG: DUF5752 family protein [Candidatus Zixiibacteriota bacterium]
MTPFTIMDCALLTRMSGLPPAFNLREFRDRIAACGQETLYHHFCESSLRASFDNPEYRNDFAVWAKQSIGDRVLAERLGILDPYEFENMEELRAVVHEILDERLAELSPWVPTARPGNEMFFMQATTVAFDTGQRIAHPSQLAQSIRDMTIGSIHYHFLEGLRRPPLHEDDFTAWLKDYPGDWSAYTGAIGSIDFYFHTLAGLREVLSQTLDAIGIVP